MIKFQTNVNLANLTTFKIGGKAKYFCEVLTATDLKQVIEQARQKRMPFFVLGGGSNLLIDDKGFSGLVIKIKTQPIKTIEESVIEVSAGFRLSELVGFCLENELSGMEWASGIPKATLGGTLYMNAGAFGQKIADIVEKVEVFNTKTLKTEIFTFLDCAFGYKQSIFKENKNLIILKAILKMEQKEKIEIEKEIKSVLQYRKEFHPMAFASAGSIFKNPKQISAAELIEKCGLKEKQIGKAQIAKKHANFIINLGGAKANDVKKLIKLIKKEVKKVFKIDLKEEVEYLNFS